MALPRGVIGRRRACIHSGLDRYGLTADGAEGCVCRRCARGSIVPSQVLLVMRCSWSELKTIEVQPLAVADVCSLGRVLVYLLDVGRRDVSGVGWGR